MLSFRWRRRQILGVVEVELFDRGKAVDAVRAKHEIECFTDSALADVVRSDKERVSIEVEHGRRDTAKIADGQSGDFHIGILTRVIVLDMLQLPPNCSKYYWQAVGWGGG